LVEGVHGLNGLVEAGLITEGDRREMREAYDFMLRVRNDLHFLTGRHTDVLTLALQQQVAPILDSRIRPGDAGFRALYARLLPARDVGFIRLRRRISRRWSVGMRSGAGSSVKGSRPAVGGFVMRDGVLELDERVGWV
jgi:hypothetical protein